MEIPRSSITRESVPCCGYGSVFPPAPDRMPMNMALIDIVDPEPGPVPLQDRRPPGGWYPVELRILRDRFRQLGGEVLARDWLPEFEPGQIEKKADQLGL